VVNVKEFDYNVNLVFGSHFYGKKSQIAAKYTRKPHNWHNQYGWTGECSWWTLSPESHHKTMGI